MTILSMVHAEKEGQIESKLQKARQLEEIREAKRREQEAKQEQKRAKLVRLFFFPFPCDISLFFLCYWSLVRTLTSE